MQEYLLLMLLIGPFLTSGAIILYHSQPLISLLMWMVSAIAAALLTVLSGITWLRVCQRNWVESQASGFIFIPIILPFYAYIGAVAGSSLVVFLYRYGEGGLPSPVFQVIALGFTVVLSGLIPAAIAGIPCFSTPVISSSGKVVRFLAVPMFAMFIGGMSAWLGSELTYALWEKSVFGYLFTLLTLYHSVFSP